MQNTDLPDEGGPVKLHQRMLETISFVLVKKMISGCFVNKALGFTQGFLSVFRGL